MRMLAPATTSVMALTMARSGTPAAAILAAQRCRRVLTAGAVSICASSSTSLTSRCRTMQHTNSAAQRPCTGQRAGLPAWREVFLRGTPASSAKKSFSLA
jgi:hypothetical protein